VGLPQDLPISGIVGLRATRFAPSLDRPCQRVTLYSRTRRQCVSQHTCRESNPETYAFDSNDRT